MTLKERLRKAAIAAAYLCLPYSVPAVALGAGGYYGYGLYRKARYGERLDVSNADWDASGDVFAAFVLGAPISLPVLAYDKVRRLVTGQAKPTERREAVAEAKRWLKAAFAAEGIPFVERMSLYGIYLDAEPSEAQEAAFAELVAATAQRFAAATLQDIANLVRPHRLLDEAWAKRHSLEDWAEDVANPCRRCGGRFRDHWIFGRDGRERFARHETMKAQMIASYRATEAGRRFPDTPTLDADGTLRALGPLCQDCRDALIAELRGAKADPQRP